MVRIANCAFAILMLLTWSSIGICERYVLFTPDGEPHPRYNNIVRQIVAHDVLVFSDGAEFIVTGERLGGGQMNFIFPIETNNALRIPQRMGFFRSEYGDEFDYREVIDAYLDGARALAANNFPVVSVDHRRSLPRERVVQKKVTILLKYSELPQRIFRTPEDPAVLAALDSLFLFAEDTARFTAIEDLHDENLVYTQELGWIALDFFDQIADYHGHSIANIGLFQNLSVAEDHQSLFRSVDLIATTNSLPRPIRDKLEAIVADTRRDRANLWRYVGSSCYLLNRALTVMIRQAFHGMQVFQLQKD